MLWAYFFHKLWFLIGIFVEVYFSDSSENLDMSLPKESSLSKQIFCVRRLVRVKKRELNTGNTSPIYAKGVGQLSIIEPTIPKEFDWIFNYLAIDNVLITDLLVGKETMALG
jgi:hypothetical protein